MSVLRVRKTFLAGGGFPLVLAKCSWLAHGAGYPRKHTSDRVRIWAFSQFLSRSAEAKLGHSMLPIVCCVFPIWLSGIFCCGSKSRALICSKLVWHVLLCLLGWFNLWNSCKCSVLLLFWVYLTCLDSLDSIKHRSSTGITISNIYIYNMCVLCVCVWFSKCPKNQTALFDCVWLSNCPSLLFCWIAMTKVLPVYLQAIADQRPVVSTDGCMDWMGAMTIKATRNDLAVGAMCRFSAAPWLSGTPWWVASNFAVFVSRRWIGNCCFFYAFNWPQK